MIGLVVLALFAGYLYLVGKTTLFIAGPYRPGQSYWKRGILLIILAILPFGDEVIGRLQFAHECKKAEHYVITDAIKNAHFAREDDNLTVKENLKKFMPIEKVTVSMVNATTGERLLTTSSHFTYGGWIMRAGLNLGSFSSCHPEGGSVQLMKKLGFTLRHGGYYERSSGQ